MPRWAVVATLYACTVSTAASALVLHRFYTFDGLRASYGRALVWQGLVYFSWGALVPAVAWAGRRFALRGVRAHWLARAPAYTVAGLVLAPAHAAFAVWVSWLARPRPAGAPRASSGTALPPMLVERLPVDFLIYWGLVGVLYAVDYAAEVRRRERAGALLEAELARAQLRALTAQLQPHFLFNALQGIATLIRRDPDTAARMTVRLGDLLRATLRRPGDHEVPLRDELALLANYLEVEAMRFGDRLRVEYDVDPAALECPVPDLVLQPLAENAIKHGIAPLPRGGRLLVAARRDGDRLHLRVEDDGAGLPADWRPDAPTGLGLAITRERLAALHDHDARLTVEPGPDGTGVVARVELPVRT